MREQELHFLISDKNFLFVVKNQIASTSAQSIFLVVFFKSVLTTQAFARVCPFQYQNPHKGSKDMVAKICFFQEMLWEEANHFNDFNSNAEIGKMAQQVKVIEM